jgi:hypothetical protein
VKSYISGPPARLVERLHEIAPATDAAVIKNEGADLRDSARYVADCPEVRLQEVSPFPVLLKEASTRGLTAENSIQSQTNFKRIVH